MPDDPPFLISEEEGVTLDVATKFLAVVCDDPEKVAIIPFTWDPPKEEGKKGRYNMEKGYYARIAAGNIPTFADKHVEERRGYFFRRAKVNTDEDPKVVKDGDVEVPSTVFIDVDDDPDGDFVNYVVELCGGGKPLAILMSGGGIHLFYRAGDADIKKIVNKISKLVPGMDASVKNPSRMSRVPGTWNPRREKRCWVQLIDEGSYPINTDVLDRVTPLRPCDLYIIQNAEKVDQIIRANAGSKEEVHQLRIALGASLLTSGIDPNIAAHAFRRFPDYEYDKSLRQLESLVPNLKGRWGCEKMRAFGVFPEELICKKCRYPVTEKKEREKKDRDERERDAVRHFTESTEGVVWKFVFTDMGHILLVYRKKLDPDREWEIAINPTRKGIAAIILESIHTELTTSQVEQTSRIIEGKKELYFQSEENTIPCVPPISGVDDDSFRVCYGKVERVWSTKAGWMDEYPLGDRIYCAVPLPPRFWDAIGKIKPDVSSSITDRASWFSAIHEKLEVCIQCAQWLLQHSLWTPESHDGTLLCIGGPTGSGKSSLGRKLMRIFSTRDDVATTPNDERDMLTTLVGSHVIFFDEAEETFKKYQRVILQSSTGVQYVTRRLYTTSTSVRLRIRTLMGFTSTDFVVHKPGIVDRVRVVRLDQVEQERQTEQLLAEPEREKIWEGLVRSTMEMLVLKDRRYENTRFPKLARVCKYFGRSDAEWARESARFALQESELIENLKIIGVADIDQSTNVERLWTTTEILKEVRQLSQNYQKIGRKKMAEELRTLGPQMGVYEKFDKKYRRPLWQFDTALFGDAVLPGQGRDGKTPRSVRPGE